MVVRVSRPHRFFRAVPELKFNMQDSIVGVETDKFCNVCAKTRGRVVARCQNLQALRPPARLGQIARFR